MNTIDCIKTRRSRGLFLDKAISNEQINQILECGTAAPSSMDCQPWQFVIVRDKNKKEQLANLKSENNRQHILTAPVVIVVCIDTEKSPTRYIEDGVTATQNILLAVHDLGLGSVYVTGYNPSDPAVADELRTILSIPNNIIPIVILPVGYVDPAEKLGEKNLVDLDSIKHYNNWRVE